MDLQLKGKRAFVSGSTTGIGKAIVKTFLQEGAKVVVHGRKQDSIAKAVDEFELTYGQGYVSGLCADFLDPDSVEALSKHLSDIDILVNNVGIYEPATFTNSSDASWHRHFQMNVMSGVRLSRVCLPQMLTRGWGRIIFISSECATLVPEDMIAYSVSKAALHALSRGLAQLTRGTEVTVNVVAPGSTFTEGAQEFLEKLAREKDQEISEVAREFFTTVRTSSLLQRFADPSEVAGLVAYLASPLAVATNGATVRADGGSMGGIF